MNEEKLNDGLNVKQSNVAMNKPSNAFVSVSWITLITGITAYMIGLYNADMMLNEKG